MRQVILSFLFLFSIHSFIIAQDKVTISGKAIDEVLKLPVEAATVYLSLAKDSAVVDYSITDKDGNFKLEVRKIQEPVFFSISDDLNGDFRVEYKSLTENKNLGEVTLKTVINLDEAVVTGSAPPIRIKNDTLEFNASSFKVRPDANVETLLKQLPGVEIDDEGKITVNGKEVSQILVNGKPFFDETGKIALQNLPADIIQKVQVTDKKTKKEEISGAAASGNESSINLTIDEKDNKGYMLKVQGGYGTDDRYESNLMLNYFNGDTKLSVLGAANNINAVGFSMDDIFDTMSGGRNRSIMISDNGSFNINGVQFGGDQGITESRLGGLNYADQFGKKLEFNGTYYYTGTEANNNNKAFRQNFLPDDFYTTESESVTHSESDNHNLSTNFEFKIDSTSQIWMSPKFSRSESFSVNDFYSSTYGEENDLRNENTGTTRSDDFSNQFSNDVNYFKSFRNKSEISVSLSHLNQTTENDMLRKSETLFYQGEEPDDLRNQLGKSRNTSDRYGIEAEYGFKVLDSMDLKIGANYEKELISDRLNTFDFDEGTNDYSYVNEELTNYIHSDLNNANPYVSFTGKKRKLRYNLNLGTQILTQKNYGNYLGEKYYVKQDFVLPSANLNMNFSLSKSANLYLTYNYEVTPASAKQLLPIEDLSNPLNTTVGNPDLDPTKMHTLYVGINNFNFQTKTGIFVNFGGNFNETGVVSYRTLNENFVTTTTYRNIHGNYNFWGGVSYSKTFKHEGGSFKIGAGFNVNQSHNEQFLDEVRYEANSTNLRPRVNFNWDLGEALSVNTSYRMTYSETRYRNFTIDRNSNVSHNFKIEATSYWPKHFVFGNDFGYTYNSRIADGFKKDFFLWNTSLAYNFWKDQLTFKVKVYDVLNQNISSTRTITDNYILDEQNDVLRRYVMFSLGFKLDKFGGKDKKRGGRLIIFD